MGDSQEMHKFSSAQLSAFEAEYDSTHEDTAAQTRGEFLKSFPIRSLQHLTLENYAIGHQLPTFCTHVEVKTRPWATIQGATAMKFGIYFGMEKHDPRKKYRFRKRFGDTQDDAFRSVKSALLDLVRLGRVSEPDFQKIDDNPLSQMFKAKILSLYFPERFLNVCSAGHLELLGDELGFGAECLSSEYQHLLLKIKLSNKGTRQWSNPKFMTFLYRTYIRSRDKKKTATVIPTKEKIHRKVNFEDIQKQRGRIGEAAEKYAVEWEIQRLEGLDLGALVPKIEDRRDRPGYGYDFLSHTAPNLQRFIEVKAVGKLSGGKGYRFFLSDNEFTVSESQAHRKNYFFYLVFFDSSGKPSGLKPFLASEIYQRSNMTPASYVVQFDVKEAVK